LDNLPALRRDRDKAAFGPGHCLQGRGLDGEGTGPPAVILLGIFAWAILTVHPTVAAALLIRWVLRRWVEST
jgi:hypothetical protein